MSAKITDANGLKWKKVEAVTLIEVLRIYILQLYVSIFYKLCYIAPRNP